jgi:hypothetical protein
MGLSHVFDEEPSQMKRTGLGHRLAIEARRVSCADDLVNGELASKACAVLRIAPKLS